MSRKKSLTLIDPHLCQLLLGGDVVPDVAELLLHHPDGLEVCGVVEGVAAEEEELDQVAGDVSAGDIQAPREDGRTYHVTDLL